MTKKDQRGFTIIEVLIVLAIAGLIMLIVFMAVPALQRNSRNTQRKNDVSAVLAAVSEYVSNHSGKLPDSTTFITLKNDVKFGYYDADDVSLATNVANGTSIETMVVVTGAKCDVDNINAEAGSSRQYSVLYNLEGSTGKICQES
jgi:prepilin-type N-terminal cleavage/methylation domain-containing protein